MSTLDHRTVLANGLRALAAFLEANPGVPAPVFVSAHHFARGTDEEIRAEIDAIATLLGTTTDVDDPGDKHRRAAISFGPVDYTAVGIPSAARARHAAVTSYENCIVPDPA
ncbi:hypothetical protein [Streptosporangium sandarakinum]|uniref:hypothetical protein n=1 Tax=Streptosporangium sandarakinum TaxID=1260955 RepID=UPI0037B6A64A